MLLAHNQVFDLFDHCKLYTLRTINFVLYPCRSITISVNTIRSFFIRTFDKNVEAEINQNYKNLLRTFLRLKALLHCEMFRATCLAMFWRHCGGTSGTKHFTV